VDIVCYHTRKGQVIPLLLVECKARPPKAAVLSQINGYNFFIHAPFAALAWPGHIAISHQATTWYEGSPHQLPLFQELISNVYPNN
jgi:hypothetical protein